MKNTEQYPEWTCAPCGNLHGSRKQKNPQKDMSTWHYGICDICEKNGFVTQSKDFGVFKEWMLCEKLRMRL